MTPIKRAVVALDLSSADQSIVQYAGLAERILGLSRLYFVHIIPDLVAPEHEDLDFHRRFATQAPLDEVVKARLLDQIQPQFSATDPEKIAVDVIEGRPYQKLAHWVEVKDADLLLFGKKKKSSGSGITARRAARQVECNLFLVPDTPPSGIKRILVPMDFSDNSVRALLQAFSIKKSFPQAGIQVVHLLRILTADHYYGMTSMVNYRTEALQAARKAYANVLKTNGIAETEAPIVIMDDAYGNVFRHLWEYTQEEQPDLVVMGAQGHSAMHHFFYGSVTEDFVDYCEGIPILVVR